MSLGDNGQDRAASYARAALERECDALAATTHGRNDQLNRSAYAVGQLVDIGGLSEGEAIERLTEASKANGYFEKDGPQAVQATIRSGIEKGRRAPRQLPATNGYHSKPHAAADCAIIARKPKPKPAPQIVSVALPTWTAPNRGEPPLLAIGQDQPPLQRDELPGRRHTYTRAGEAVRVKIKKGSGSPYIDFYRVRRPDTDEVGWQYKKPAGYVPAPYIGAGDPFSAEFVNDVLFWPEGEKDVDALVRHCAQSFTFGGSSDVPEGFEVLAGRDIVILADNDEVGLKCAEQKARRYVETAARIRILVFDELDDGQDVSDYFAAGATQEMFWARVDAAPVVPRPSPLVSATPFLWIDPSTIPPRGWLYGWHYIRKFISCTISPGGIGKSTLAIAEAFAIVTGRPLLGIRPVERVNVWYWNGEDPKEELERRVMATAVYHEIAREEFEGRLYVDSGRAQPLIVARQTKEGVTIATPIVEGIREAIRDRRIGLMIIDPFVSSHQVTENDNNAIEAVATTWAHIADETGCAIELVHHARKTGANEVTVEDGRGAIALHAKARSARALNAMTEKEAEEAGIENRRLHFRSFDGKANLAPPSDKSMWLRIASIDLGNSRDGRPSDSVGVATPWEWPDPLQSVDVTDLRAIQDTVSKGEYRANSRAAGWVGKVVAQRLGLDPDEKKDRARIVKMIRIWIRNRMLKTVRRKAEDRHEYEYVEVDQWA